MNPMNPKRTRRLRARAATMNPAEDYDDYGPEPNMKLSHAFLVVLMLHVIAVAGLYAFNSMKAGKVPATKVAKTAPPAPVEQPPENQGSPSGGSGQKPPSETKAPPVAKVAEAPKATKPAPTATKNAEVAGAQNNPGGAKGLLASAKGMLAKAAGVGVAATGASKANAQAPTSAESNAVTPAESAPAASKTYTVRSGDTMTRIASSLGVAIPDLEKINGMTEKSVIQVGQILKVPEKPIAQVASTTEGAKNPGAVAPAANGAVVASTNANAPADAAGAPMTEYTVVKGDSPYKIAKKFKITPDELMKANGITDPKKIQIGQQLKIPAAPPKKGK